MKNQITIREAVTEKDVERFWAQLYDYYRRDVFSETDGAALEYFLGPAYRGHIMEVRNRARDRGYFLFFVRDGQEIGFAMPVIFTSEDGKCFIMECCVYPAYRGSGTGGLCARALLSWAEAHGARYSELNCGEERRRRFWKSVGFCENGADEWGEPLMLLPPREEVPFHVKLPEDPEDWQLLKLENGFKQEIGEAALTEEAQRRLQQAIRDGKITFFAAKRGYRTVGMCSVARCYSTFTCAETAVFEDFYIEPVFRRKGIARKLVQAAQGWCKENGIASLSVCCAPCDEGMYRSLGFAQRLGMSFAYLG